MGKRKLKPRKRYQRKGQVDQKLKAIEFLFDHWASILCFVFVTGILVALMLDKIGESHKAEALTTATVAMGAAAKVEFERRTKEQTQALQAHVDEQTQKQTADIHEGLQNKVGEWLNWQSKASSGSGQQAGYEGDAESEANQRARQAWKSSKQA